MTKDQDAYIELPEGDGPWLPSGYGFLPLVPGYIHVTNTETKPPTTVVATPKNFDDGEQ